MSDQPMTVTDEDRALIKALLDANDELCRAIDNGLAFTGECELAAAHRIAAAQAERDARPVITLTDAEKIELIGKGAQAERDAIVKWLQGDLNAEMVEAISFQISLALQETSYVGAKYSLRIAGDIAQAIEAREHLTPPSA